MEMIVIVFLVASVVLLCLFAVFAMRRKWQKAFLALLGTCIFLLLIALLLQSNVAVLRLSIMQDQARQIEELKQGSSKKASEAIVSQGGVQPQR
jgi:multisubunit Na+/H+ antiporter MnhE subunit